MPPSKRFASDLTRCRSMIGEAWSRPSRTRSSPAALAKNRSSSNYWTSWHAIRTGRSGWRWLVCCICSTTKRAAVSRPSSARTPTATYGDLRARLFEKFAPKKRRRKGLRPEELIDPVTAKELGIQENDLWIAAQAIERNLVLVTNDAMARIQEVASELKVEDWAASSS